MDPEGQPRHDLSHGWSAGIVGARGIGAVHAREIMDAHCARLYVSGRDLESAQQAASRLPQRSGIHVEAISSLEALAQTGARFISICSPTELHAEHCRALRNSGAFLLVEKPMLWRDGARKQDLIEEARSLFRLAEDRLAVNHPTGFLGSAFADTSGWEGPLQKLDFRYRTRGRYRFKFIAVDLLPHALSLLLTLAHHVGAEVARPHDVRISCAEDHWRLDAQFGRVHCSFDFSQDPAQSSSELSFAVDGIEVMRKQKQTRDTVAVDLAFDGRNVRVPNPMTTSIQRAISAAKAGTVIPGEADYSVRIIELMADLLEEP